MMKVIYSSVCVCVCVFDDAEGTAKMLIREDIFTMAENGIEAAWKQVMTRPSDEEFANRKGKEEERGNQRQHGQ